MGILRRHRFSEILPFAVLLFLGAAILVLFWPGILRPDSHGQYAQALVATYSDHHPPMMALYWRLLSFLYPGPGLMFATHVSLLWVASAIMVRLCQNTGYRWGAWLYVFLPLWPSILGHSLFVLKDASFTLSFLVVSSVLTFYTVIPRRLSWVGVGSVLVILFYGMAVKFQAAYIIPIVLLWLAFVIRKQWGYRTVALWIVLLAVFWGGLSVFNRAVTDRPSHSWQYVKLYDLAAISLALDRPLFPDFVQEEPAFSMEAIKQHFSTERVDDLVFGENPFLIKGRTSTERQELWDRWFDVVREYPGVYFQHRIRLAKHLFTKSPIKSVQMVHDVDMIPSRIMEILESFSALFMRVIQEITKFQYMAPLLLVYFGVGVVRVRHTPWALPLVFMTGMGITLIGVLFIFSMASDVRYIYLSVCCLHFSHFLAYRTFLSQKTV